MHHQLTRYPLTTVLQQGSLAGQLQWTAVVIVRVVDTCSTCDQVRDHVLSLFPDCTPESCVTLSISQLGVCTIVQKMSDTVQLTCSGSTYQGCFSPAKILSKTR